jgi:hypothetical protein
VPKELTADELEQLNTTLYENINDLAKYTIEVEVDGGVVSTIIIPREVLKQSVFLIQP